jgi:hypothetical protein
MIAPSVIRKATHLGDGLYALWDGQDIALFTLTPDEARALDIVYLNHDVRRSFVDFMRSLVSGETKPVKFE